MTKRWTRWLLTALCVTALSGGVSAQAPTAVAPPAAAPATPAALAAPQPDSVAYPPGLNTGASVDLQCPVPADTKAPTTSELIQNVAHNKISINIVCVNEEFVQPTIDGIIAGSRTGNIGDGKIFITDLQECIRIRTGEKG